MNTGIIAAGKSADLLGYLKTNQNQGLSNGISNNNYNKQEKDTDSPLSALDSLDLSPEANYAYTKAKAQFEINFQTIKSISGPEGSYYEEVNFSLKGSFEFLQAASGQSPINTDELDAESLIEKMQDLFSPEKTAQRILDFALAQYAPQGEDNEEARQEFSDYIGAAIQKGFDDAQNILGKLEDSIQEGIDKTHELVFGGLEDFVTNGLSADHEEKSQAIKEYAQQFSLSVQMEYSSVRAYSYNSSGELENSSATDASEPFEVSA